MKNAFFALCILITAATATAQENFFPDGEHFSAIRGGKIVKIEYFNDKVVDTLLDLPYEEVKSHILSPDGMKALLISKKTPIYRHSFTADYSVADFATGKATPLLPTSAAAKIRDASFSPDGGRVAYVRGNDLFLTDLGNMREFRITGDGKRNEIINGVTDWVYEEEFAFTKAYEFSPDGSEIAFLRFDESRVREFAMMRYDEKLYPESYLYKYPKAGEENSVVTLHVHNIASGETRRIDTGPQTDQYIPRIGWTPSGELFFYRVNRRQNVFEVMLAGSDGSIRTIYEEVSPRYVERPDEETITFLPDGDRFIVKNETRTGWMHLYLYSIKKGYLNAITSGEWEVTELLGVRDGTVWYMSTEVSPFERHLYSVKFNGKNKTRLTHEKGTYEITPTPGLKYYEQICSDIGKRDSDIHMLIVPVENSRDKTPKEKIIPTERPNAPAIPPIKGDPEFFTFAIDGGITLNGYMIKPTGFDPAKKHPIFMSQYSGPGSQSVTNEEIGAGDRMIFNPLLEAGYIVACVDGRGTGGRGEEFKKCTYGQLGRYETEDQIAAARYLCGLSWVDASRIGIYGWSYGGFMALNCILKGADVFKLAVAVAPVTSWRYYDSIYTEIYNGLPQDNPGGYDDNSPINFAKNLKGKLLIIHGTGDDNVHIQNSYEMAKELVEAGKQFDMMVYPDDNHSMRPNGWMNVRQKIAEYVIREL